MISDDFNRSESLPSVDVTFFLESELVTISLRISFFTFVITIFSLSAGFCNPVGDCVGKSLSVYIVLGSSQSSNVE